MSYIKVTKENNRNVEIFYKDWGNGKPIVFSHGWPLSSDAWEDQMFFLASKGFRCIAHDRRGHGKSSQTWTGNDMNTYADDLAKVIEELNLNEITLVGHSTGGGEVARYIGRHGNKRVSKVVLIGSITPFLLKTPSNPQGVPMEAFNDVRNAIIKDRSQYFKDFSTIFYGANRAGAKVSQGLLDFFWLQSMRASIKAVFDCVKVYSETDLTEDLKKFEVPTLILHGDDDQVVPINDSAVLAAKLIKNSKLIIHKGAPHGMPSTHKEQINKDIFDFLIFK